MDVPIPTINLPPPYSNEMTPANPSRQASTYQTTANTHVPDTAGMLSRALGTPNTTINLNNSSHVTIGPMTQFNDRVTIYQYMDATLNHNKKGIEPSDSKKPSKPSHFNLRANWLNILALCAILLGVSTTVYFIIYTINARNPNSMIHSYDFNKFPAIDGHYFIGRDIWGAQNHSKVKNMKLLNRPVRHVVVGHMGVQTEPCFKVYECSVKMRSIQDNAMGNKGLLDVSANFYLGGDGNIYIGRDWFYENSYGTKSLAIQFLGDFMRYELTEAQLDAMQSLLRAGIRENILAPDYKIYGLNQTKLSKYSPGVNAVRHLKKLQQFSWCGEAGNDACGRKDEISWNFNKEPR